MRTSGLATSWGDAGPPELWRRDLGEGYSGIAAVDGVLYTLLRRGEREAIVALDADTGATLWEHEYDSSTAGLNTTEGPGPHTTPAIVGQRLFAVGTRGSLRALDRTSGELLWKIELWDELGGNFRDRGYSASPLPLGDTIVLPVGGAGQAITAFDQADGSVRWSGGDFEAAHASPIVIDVGGREQIVAFLAGEVAGIEVGSGRLLWSVEHPTNWGLNISTPVWGDDGILYVSSAYSGGSRAIRLTATAAGTDAEVLWLDTRMRVHIGSVIRDGDRVYGSSGDFGPAFLVAMDLPSGELAWRDRSFSKANLVAADDLLVLLDEDGGLALLRPSPDGVEVLTRTEIFDSLAWTVPTLVDTTLYARNREEIVAIDLGS